MAIEDLGVTHAYGRNKFKAYQHFSRDLFDSWGIGRHGVNDGLLLVLFCGVPHVEIVCGKGMVMRSGKYQKRGLEAIKTGVVLPHLSCRDFGGAIEAGALELIKVVRESTLKEPLQDTFDKFGFGGGKAYCHEEQEEQDHAKEGRSSNDSGEGYFGLWLVGLVVAGFVGYYMWQTRQLNKKTSEQASRK